MPYFFTSESVSEGHPDKVADQISDAIIDAFLAQDPLSKVACETFVTTGQVVVGGEVRSQAYVDVQKVVRNTIRKIGYTKSEYQFDASSCGVLSAIHEQSADIAQGVDVGKSEDEQGAGDQGMMFGYATDETDNYMPLALDLSHRLLVELAKLRREGKQIPYLRPDAKSQVTIEYNDAHQPIRVNTIVLSTQHDDFAEDSIMLAKIKEDIINILIPNVVAQLPARVQALFDDKIIYHINPTGKFVIGGPHGDTGLTGRKIIVDTYGGKGAHGGGAFSGKDSSKVDRSAAYATRHIAKNIVAAGLAKQCLVQVAYAIGVAEPVGLFVDTYGTAQVDMNDGAIAAKIAELWDLRPAAIVRNLGLRNPIFSETAAYGHMGRTPGTVTVNGKEYETFTWEKLDRVDDVKAAFGLLENSNA
ncbi:methionine adenosyltransferase [Aureispira anguillae]|uniref:S-adenosylmethionine synthase n=1 Tax=Aureispira anguillae TaxID=2864201 RepID=A0A915YFC1_9BACT|nr:methionine adenosyltransferase [Aureispira anguillae]BDS12007.1 methionine adenosyltransferase [Aureispira anguillae]